MKKHSLLHGLFLAGLGLTVIATAGCSKSEPVLPESNPVATENTEKIGQISAATVTLTPEEINALNVMREEEMMARDVYAAFYTQYHLPVFNNIKNSENVHTTAVLNLLTYYGLPDPIANHQPGVFSNPTIQTLYDQLVAQGSHSIVQALYAGATIEDMDIVDLKIFLLQVTQQKIITVFKNIQNGSMNHLRTFNAQLLARGVTYVPQYLTPEEFAAIISGN